MRFIKKNGAWIITAAATLALGIAVLVWQSIDNGSSRQKDGLRTDFLQWEKMPRQQESSQQETSRQKKNFRTQETPLQQDDHTQEGGKDNTPPPNTPHTGGLSEGSGEPNEEIILDAGASDNSNASGGGNSNESAGNDVGNSGGNASTGGTAPEDDENWGPLF